VTLNADHYYFADTVNRARFEREPLRWAGALTDPVTMHRFRPGAGTVTAMRRGRTWWFESASTRERFARDTTRYALTARMRDE
jgi:YHS domain-containing protein